jgi:hypothetical protein
VIKSVNAVATAHRVVSRDDRPYVAVVLDDDDKLVSARAYAKRFTAQAQASRADGETPDGWRRGFVAAPTTTGGVAVLSGHCLIGTVEACSSEEGGSGS